MYTGCVQRCEDYGQFLSLPKRLCLAQTQQVQLMQVMDIFIVSTCFQAMVQNLDLAMTFRFKVMTCHFEAWLAVTIQFP